MLNSEIEKYAVFSQGFKGMPSGWHSLGQMNFLVGENSVGKSSFLQLLDIVESTAHRQFLNICGVVDGLDTSFDICSRLSGASSVTIGFRVSHTEPEYDDDRKQVNKVIRKRLRLITYKERGEGLEPRRMTILLKDQILDLKKFPTRIGFRLLELPEEAKDDEQILQQYLQDSHFEKASFNRNAVKLDIELPSYFPLWFNAILGASEKLPVDDVVSSFIASSTLNCFHFGPMREKINRIHYGANNDFSSTGKHTPYMVRDLERDNAKGLNDIANFGKSSGLFDKVSIPSMKTPAKDRPFALQLRKEGKHFYVDELGYGVGQVFPIVAELAISHKSHTLLIEQPELHLHPQAQASLGELFYESVIDGRILVIETHSDFIMDRFRMCLGGGNKKPTSQILYFEKDLGTDLNVCTPIPIKDDGSIGEAPSSYRDFFINEGLRKFETL